MKITKRDPADGVVARWDVDHNGCRYEVTLRETGVDTRVVENGDKMSGILQVKSDRFSSWSLVNLGIASEAHPELFAYHIQAYEAVRRERMLP